MYGLFLSGLGIFVAFIDVYRIIDSIIGAMFAILVGGLLAAPFIYTVIAQPET